jgi:hypothetical protein
MPSRRLVDTVFNGRRFPGRRFSQSDRIKLLRPHHSMASNAPATYDRSSGRISCAPGLARVREGEPVADDGRTGRVAWISPAERLVWSKKGRASFASSLASSLVDDPPQGKPACGVSFQLSGSGRKDMPAFLDSGSLWCFGYRLASQSRSDTPSPYGPAAVELDIPARRHRGLVLLRPPTLLLAGFRLFSCSWTSVRMSGAAHRT